MEHYTPPKIPTLASKPNLCELPKRWAKNAAVVACIGVLAAGSLAGCAVPQQAAETRPPYHMSDPAQRTQFNYNDLDFEMRMHHGGSGSAMYVVHLTEQEMQGFITAQLESAGVNFDNVVMSFISWEDNNRQFSHRGREHAHWVAVQLAEDTDLPVGVFYNPGETVGQGSSRGMDGVVAPTDDEINAALPILEARLHAQANDFLYQLGKPIATDDLQFTLHQESWTSGEISRYTVQLTEQQATSIIHTELIAAGLDLNRVDIAIELGEHWRWQLQIRMENGITVGEFCNPILTIASQWFDGSQHQPPATPSQQQAVNAAPVLRARLVAQAQAFITHLQAEGVL